MADIQVIQSAAFRRAYKRLHPNQKADVDDAVQVIVARPDIGEAKKGDLAGVFVYSSASANSRCWPMSTIPPRVSCYCSARTRISIGN